MEHYVITISRKFGCLGHEIAGCLGELLGVPVYDRSAVEAQVLSTGAEARLLAATQLEEGRKKAQFLLFRKEADGEKDLRVQVMFQAQSEALKSFVEKSSCIILGRGGDEVFRTYPRCMNVYIFAPDEVRLQNCVRMLHTDEEAARALIHREDKAREDYRRQFCSHASDVTYGRHILMDSSLFGAEESARILEQAARYLFSLPKENQEDSLHKAGGMTI